MSNAAAMTANYSVKMFCARHADLFETVYHSRIDGCLDTLIAPPSIAYMAEFAASQRTILADRQFARIRQIESGGS